jgi:[acyl-carrier-protein] S-malonyltransferase
METVDRIAILFPGQGSHADGMDAPLRGTRALRHGLELLGFDPFARLAEGTRFQQPALFLCSVAAWERDRPAGVVAAAGHSLGEYAALVAAGALDFEDALAVVRVRGEAMAAAPPGGMTAFLGGDSDEVRALAGELGLTVANDNAPGQLVLSGPLDALGEAEARTDARARRLDVSGAFHSPLMAGAADALREALARVEVRAPAFPVWSNGTARPFTDVRAELVANLLRPVRWRETVLGLRAAGVEDFAEVGPGRVLTGLVRRTLREVAA